MATQLSHPYKDHPEPYEWPKERIEEIEEIYEWYVNIIMINNINFK